MTDNLAAQRLADALWRLYKRPESPVPWVDGGNLPWDDAEFSERMLREHLDQSHGAASRKDEERAIQTEWLFDRLALKAGDSLLDVTCGPGLYSVDFARRGVQVTGIDFAPAAVRYARELARKAGVADLCRFLETDVHTVSLPPDHFNAAVILYGQLAVMSRQEAARLVQKIANALKSGGVLIIELLNPDHINRNSSNWWFTDNQGLWGDAPFLCLGEREWREAEQLSVERFYVLHLETGQFDHILLCDQAYQPADVASLVRSAGLEEPDVYPAWDGLPLYDAQEWLVYRSCKKDYTQ